jgi:tetratricopeptide (TPR) repeat protein
MEYFKQAITSDPDVPLPYAGLADCYLSLVSYGVIAPNDGMPRAKQMAAKALELEPTLVPALCSAAMSFFSYDWQAVLAEQYFHRAIELNPSYAIAHQWYSLLLTAGGRSDEALGALAKARELDPLSLAVTTHTAWALYFREDYADALRHCSHALELQPEFNQALVLRGMVHAQIGMVNEAVVDLEKAVALAGRDETGIITLAHAYAASGRGNRAHRILDRVITQRGRYWSAYAIAAVYVALGEFDGAWKWLERAYQERNFYMPMLGIDPRFAALRGDLRFADLVQKVGSFSPARTS